MAKGGKKRIRSNTDVWSAADHALRDERKKKLKSAAAAAASNEDAVDNNNNAKKRVVDLSHGTASKREDQRLQLHLTKVKRELEIVKEKLENWDPDEQEPPNEEDLLATEENAGEKKKKVRPGPETWKLRGPARPAWEVYDFDTRYIDPHIEAHKKSKAKLERSQNILALYRGRLGTFIRDNPTAYSAAMGRRYLGLWMQLGHLAREAKQFKMARHAWLECIELEGDDTPMTTAREDLIRMYLDLKRFDSALRLGGERFAHDSSVWIRYTTALAAIQDNSSEAEKHLVDAILSNPFCAYYLAFYSVFVDVYEYTEALEDAEEGPQSSLEEAIEYCANGQHGAKWKGEPSIKLRNLVLQGLAGKHQLITAQDLQWEERLAAIEKEHLSRESLENSGSDAEDAPSDGDPKNPVDVIMYVGMFRTAMEMVKEEGHF